MTDRSRAIRSAFFKTLSMIIAWIHVKSMAMVFGKPSHPLGWIGADGLRFTSMQVFVGIGDKTLGLATISGGRQDASFFIGVPTHKSDQSDPRSA